MNDVKQSLSHTSMELQIPHRLCAKVSEKSILRTESSREVGEILRTLCELEEGEDRRSRGMP